MAVRINENSCKNALGTVFLLATAFFVCSTFISMRSVFADPIAPQNAGVVSSGRQSPRSSQRTSNQTISRSTVSRGTTGATVASSRSTASRSTVSRGTATSRSVSSRSTAPTRQSANVVSRNVSSRGQATRSSANNRAVRARTATNATRVAATGNVTSGGDRASVNTTYSYLNSRLYTGNYSNIIDSTTGLISAEAYSNCMDSYYACMDEICTARSAAKGRCSCAGRAVNFLAAEEALESANEELITLSGQLSLLIATKGKGDEIASAFTLTEAEQVMNCVSWQEMINQYGSSDTEKIKDWYEAHNLSGVSSTSNGAPDYCTSNKYGFTLDSLTNPNVTGSSSDILAQLKAWADAKDLAKQYQSSDNTLFTKYGNTLSSVISGLAGTYLVGDAKEAELDTLAKKWGYKLFEYAHNNVCGRVLDSCFNGIYEACGTPPTVIDSDNNKHTKCMNGATTSCPFNYNSYIQVKPDDGSTSSDEASYSVVLNERSSGSTTDKSSAACFGYSTTTSSTGTRTTTSSSDPYYNLRGPVADARRSIMQKYLLDANSACDVYGESLKSTAQNINYQKVAAQQALQQKRLEFKQQEDSETESNYTTYASNFVSCIDELLECYENYSGQGWSNSRLKTYCAQKSNVQHCYEPMVCSPSRLGLKAVIDMPDDSKCTFEQDFRKNTCRNVVTISEILYPISSTPVTDLSSIEYGKTYDSAALREGCLLEASVDKDVRMWSQYASSTYPCSATEVRNLDAHARVGEKDDKDGACLYVSSCDSGYILVNNHCQLARVACNDEIANAVTAWREYTTIGESASLGSCKVETCVSGYHPTDDQTACIENTTACTDAQLSALNAVAGKRIWNGTAWSSECYATQCKSGYSHDNNSGANACVLTKTSEGCSISFGTAEKTWNGTSYGECEVTECNSGYHTEDSISCISNTDTTCSTGDEHASGGKRIWNTLSGGWGSCEVTGCKVGYTIGTSGTCVPVSEP